MRARSSPQIATCFGVVIANSEFIARDFAPRYAFSHEGHTTYARKVVVPVRSPAKTLADLRGKTISAVDILGDDGVGVTTRVADDLTAAANVLYGRTDAALVSESIPSSPSTRMIFASSTPPRPTHPRRRLRTDAMRDRAALDNALRSLPRTTLAPWPAVQRNRAIGEPRVAVKREIQTPRP